MHPLGHSQLAFEGNAAGDVPDDPPAGTGRAIAGNREGISQCQHNLPFSWDGPRSDLQMGVAVFGKAEHRQIDAGIGSHHLGLEDASVAQTHVNLEARISRSGRRSHLSSVDRMQVGQHQARLVDQHSGPILIGGVPWIGGNRSLPFAVKAKPAAREPESLHCWPAV